jgi:hypothetical protein
LVFIVGAIVLGYQGLDNIGMLPHEEEGPVSV